MLKNKIIFDLFIHLCLGRGINYHKSEKIIYQTFQILQQNAKLLSPIYIIETAIFNLLIPIYQGSINLNKQFKLNGNSLKQSITKVILTIIKYAKNLKKKQTIAYKLALIFLNLYKKDHILYKQKILYINKLLNI